MALPPPHENEELRRLRDVLARTPLAVLEPLRDEDYWLLGKYVQLYNFLEFNLRRAAQIFVEAGIIERPQRLGSHNLIETVKQGVMRLNTADEPAADTLGKLSEIEDRRGFRNLLAHWPAKRIPQEDALVLLSQDSADAKRMLGRENTAAHCSHAVVALPDLRGLVLHMDEYEIWLARKTAQWFARYHGTTTTNAPDV